MDKYRYLIGSIISMRGVYKYLYIKLPKSNKKFYLKNTTNYSERLEIVNQALSYRNNEIFNYALDNNKIKSKSQLSSYTRACYMLENLATYLLGRDTVKYNIAKPEKIKRIHNKELPVSSATGNAYDLMYSSNDFKDENVAINSSTILNNKEVPVSIYRKSNWHINADKQKEENQVKRFKNTSTYRLNKLYSTRKIKTYQVVPVKNNELSYIDSNGEVVKINPPSNLDQKELSKWNKRNANNVFKNPILMDQVTYIGGKDGLIGLESDYRAVWAIVDTEGKFVFDGTLYSISKAYTPYCINAKGMYDMDKVLCIALNDDVYFYSQTIEQIDQKYIVAEQPL